MNSPFPGMDPYLERRWNDVHTGLCTGIRAALQPKLPQGLRARAQEDILLEEQGDADSRQWFEADTAIVEVTNTARRGSGSSVSATIDPVLVRQIPVLQRNRWVEILDSTAGNRVVTVIEILSPGNKLSTKLNDRYRKKLSRYQEAGVSIVEIDLLRSSRNRLLIAAPDIPQDRRAAYYTCVNRADECDLWKIYPMSLRRPLPTIPIPCRETDPEVGLELQPLIDRIYEDGGHDDIDYTKEAPDPPLSPADAEWAAGVIAKHVQD